jgi:adenine-specific DNA-methyltransferase
MSIVKEELNKKKLRGGYYTPKDLTKFICDWAIDSDSDKILEPSCGDGNFLESALERLKSLNSDDEGIVNNLTGIELISKETNKAKDRLKEFRISNSSIINSDFFHHVQSNPDQKYDVVVGNPPFIRYQNFPEEHRALAMDLMYGLGFKPNRLTLF